jgi:hypothetical protein
MEEKIVYEALSVQKDQEFGCPFCPAARYVLAVNKDHRKFVVRPLNGIPCEHLNPQIRLMADGSWEVRFATPIEENAPLRKKIAYLLHSTAPFHAWLARKEKWHLVGENGRGDQSPIARFLTESLRPSYDKVWAWVGRDASIFVGVKSWNTESGDISGDMIFIPDLDKLWLSEFVSLVWEHGERKMWTAGEVIKLIESINVVSTGW